MSRTFKDRPYRILYAKLSGRKNATHSHELFGSLKNEPTFVLNEDGSPKTVTKEVIFHVSSVEKYNETLGYLYGYVTKTVAPLKTMDNTRHPNTHFLEVWRQEVKRSDYHMFDKYSVKGIRQTQVSLPYYYQDYRRLFSNNDNSHVLIRRIVNVPVVENNYVPYYEEEICTIDVPYSKENNWGWDLPCGHWGGTVHRSGENGPFARARKKREKRRNRYVGTRETREASKYYNSNYNDDSYDEEKEDFLNLTAHTLRKKNDWD